VFHYLQLLNSGFILLGNLFHNQNRLENQNYPNGWQHSSGGTWNSFQNILGSVISSEVIPVCILLPNDNILLLCPEIVQVLDVDIKPYQMLNMNQFNLKIVSLERVN